MKLNGMDVASVIVAGALVWAFIEVAGKVVGFA